jgi:hypothetical protein
MIRLFTLTHFFLSTFKREMNVTTCGTVLQSSIPEALTMMRMRVSIRTKIVGVALLSFMKRIGAPSVGPVRKIGPVGWSCEQLLLGSHH